MSAQSQGNPGMGPLQVCSNKTVPQSPQCLVSGSTHSDHRGAGPWRLKAGLHSDSGLPLEFPCLPASTVPAPWCPHLRVIALRVSTFARLYSSSKLRNLLSNCFFICKMGIINLPHEALWAFSDGRGESIWHQVWSRVT